MVNDNRIAVIGGGSWGTALVQLLSDNGNHVTWWMRSQHVVEQIRKNHHNPHYLSSAMLNLDYIDVTCDIEHALRDSKWVLLAVPAAFLHSVLDPVRRESFKEKVIISAIKGIVPETLSSVSEYLIATKGIDDSMIGILGGPCHSEEVVMQKLSYLTVAFHGDAQAKSFSALLQNRFMRVNTNTDVKGMEYSAVLKNVYAIGSGIALSLGYGDNFQAVLVVNSMDEMLRFLKAVNGKNEALNLIHYTGDLIVTAYSGFSRNRHFGSMVGKGYPLKSILDEMDMVAEGYYASKTIHDLNLKLGVDIPICDMVYRVLHEHGSPQSEMDRLATMIN